MTPQEAQAAVGKMVKLLRAGLYEDVPGFTTPAFRVGDRGKVLEYRTGARPALRVDVPFKGQIWAPLTDCEVTA